MIALYTDPARSPVDMGDRGRPFFPFLAPADGGMWLLVREGDPVPDHILDRERASRRYLREAHASPTGEPPR